MKSFADGELRCAKATATATAAEMLRELAAQEFREDLAKFQDDELEFMLDARIAALQSGLCKYRRSKRKEIRKAKVKR